MTSSVTSILMQSVQKAEHTFESLVRGKSVGDATDPLRLLEDIMAGNSAPSTPREDDEDTSGANEMSEAEDDGDGAKSSKRRGIDLTDNDDEMEVQDDDDEVQEQFKDFIAQRDDLTAAEVIELLQSNDEDAILRAFKGGDSVPTTPEPDAGEIDDDDDDAAAATAAELFYRFLLYQTFDNVLRGKTYNGQRFVDAPGVVGAPPPLASPYTHYMQKMALRAGAAVDPNAADFAAVNAMFDEHEAMVASFCAMDANIAHVAEAFKGAANWQRIDGGGGSAPATPGRSTSGSSGSAAGGRGGAAPRYARYAVTYERNSSAPPTLDGGALTCIVDVPLDTLNEKHINDAVHIIWLLVNFKTAVRIYTYEYIDSMIAANTMPSNAMKLISMIVNESGPLDDIKDQYIMYVDKVARYLESRGHKTNTPLFAT